jgi:hypothetical protein
MSTERLCTILSRNVILIGLIACASIITVEAEESPQNSTQLNSSETSTLTGIVRFSKRVPRPTSFGQEPNLDVKPPIDPVARGLQSVYVYLEPVDTLDGAQSAQKSPVTELPEVTMNQEGFRFRPQVMVVQAGQRVLFGNSDSSDHNVRA